MVIVDEMIESAVKSDKIEVGENATKCGTAQKNEGDAQTNFYETNQI